MRIKSTGIFETEALVDIAQRVMAELQEAGVSHVQNVNVYLNIIDKAGSQRSLTLRGEAVDILSIDCSDLEAQMPEPKLQLSRPGQQPVHGRRRATPQKRNGRS